MSAVSSLNTNPVFPIDSSRRTLDQKILADSWDYGLLRNHLLSKSFDSLDPKTKEDITYFILQCRFNRKGIFFVALNEKDKYVLKKLLKMGFDLNAPDPVDGLPIFYACESDWAYRFLKKSGANLDLRNERNQHLWEHLSELSKTNENNYTENWIIQDLLKDKLTPEWLEQFELSKRDTLHYYHFSLFEESGCLFIPVSETNTVFGKLVDMPVLPLVRQNGEPLVPNGEESRKILRALIFGDNSSVSISRNNIRKIAIDYLCSLIPVNSYEIGTQRDCILVNELLNETDFDNMLMLLSLLKDRPIIYSLVEKYKQPRDMIRESILSCATKNQIPIWQAVGEYEKKAFSRFTHSPVQELLKIEISPNESDPGNGQHSLFVHSFCLSSMRCLLNHRSIDFNKTDDSGLTALDYLVKCLIESESIRQIQLVNLELLFESWIPLKTNDPEFEFANSLLGNTVAAIILYCFLKNPHPKAKSAFAREFLGKQFKETIWKLASDRTIAETMMPYLLKEIHPTTQINDPNVVWMCRKLHREYQVAGSNKEWELPNLIPNLVSIYPAIPYFLNSEEYAEEREKGKSALESLNFVIQNSPFNAAIQGRKSRTSVNDTLLNDSSTLRTQLAARYFISPEEIDKININLRSCLLKAVAHIDRTYESYFPDRPIFSLYFDLLFFHKETPDLPPLLSLEDAISVIESCCQDDIRELGTFLWNHPTYMEYFSLHYLRTMRLDIRSGGRHLHSFREILFPFISSSNENVTFEDDSDFELNEVHYKFSITVMKVMKMTGEFIKQLGRTFLFKSAESAFWDAYKICKPGEGIQAFAKEAEVTRTYRMHGEFKSPIHEPVGVFLVDEIEVELPDLPLKKLRDRYLVYHYRASPDYFDYLHDCTLSNDTFREGRYRLLHDTIVQVKRRIHPFLADLYHNESQQREYLPLRDLYLNSSTTGGAGRLDHWIQSILYPNARASGIADVADVHLFRQFVMDNQPRHFRNPRVFSDISPILFYKIESTERFVKPIVLFQTNALSSLMLVDMLILAYRNHQLHQTDWRNEAHLESFAEELVWGFAMILQIYTQKEFEECRQFVLHAGVDWKRAARQLFFWIEPHGESGYIDWMTRNQVPQGLYDEKTEVRVSSVDCRNFSPEKGFSANRIDNDIGPFNGPLCLTEMEKAWWIVTTFAALK